MVLDYSSSFGIPLSELLTTVIKKLSSYTLEFGYILDEHVYNLSVWKPKIIICNTQYYSSIQLFISTIAYKWAHAVGLL